MIKNQNTTEYKEAESILASLKFSEVQIPKIDNLFSKLEKPVASPYFNFSFQRRILGAVMAVPLVVAAFAVFFSFNAESGVYLARNDESLAQANMRIMNNINALEQLSE